jgi:hypothetical protein
MKKFLRIVLVLFAILVVAIIVIVVFVKSFLPNVGSAPDIHVELTVDRLERGDYLANHVMVCIDCHSLRDWDLFSGPPIVGTEGGGGELFNREFGFPGEFYSPNITPYGLGDWTDGEIFRAITTGVTKDNRALFPLMPYLEYGKLDESDIMDVIAFIRNLPSLENVWPERELDFPVSLIVNTMPKKAELTNRPNPMDRLAYGEYMVRAAACKDCHTAAVQGKIVGEYMAGGFEFNFPDGTVLRSTNITPHITGIGLWNKDFFVNRFRSYTDTTYVPERVVPGEFQSVMPWIMYGGMSEDDLTAIFTYLQSIPAVENMVERFTFASN